MGKLYITCNTKPSKNPIDLGMKYPDKTKTYSSEEKVKFEEDEAKFNNYISTIDLSTSRPNYNG